MPARPYLPVITGFALAISCLIVAFWLAWQALVPVDFGYGFAYQVMDIDQHVQHYGPQNRYRKGFATTSAMEQKRLFSGIVKAIQNDGEGLRNLFYTTPDGRRHLLLREAEVIHLQDVANLINLFDRVAWGAIVLLLVTVGAMKLRQLPAPGIKQLLIGLAVLVGISSLILLIVGPTEVFYWLHIQIFPPEHEWFFYWQDSLMTTLMKAPDLFGLIAALWVGLALILLVAGYWGLSRWLRPATLKSRG